MQQRWKLSGTLPEKLLFISLLYLAAAMPFQHSSVSTIVPGIALMVIAWLLSGDLKNKLLTFLSNGNAVIFSALYIFYCLGFFYSENTTYAKTDLILKLPLLIFPLVLSSFPVKENKRAILKVFLFSCLFSAVISLLYASYMTHETGKNYFFYSNLTIYMHVGHYAMYLVMASFIALHFLFKEVSHGWKITWIISFAILAVTIFLLSARAQLLAFFVVIYAGIIIYFFSRKKWVMGIVVLGLSLAICIAALQLSPGIKERIVGIKTETAKFFSGDHQTFTSVTARYMIWEAAEEVIRGHPLSGVGTGDAKGELLKKAQEKNYTTIVKKDLNYHNQFLQTWAAIGLPGLSALVFSIIVGLVYAFKRNQLIIASFLLLITISFLTESMLERQAGVIFYSFFSAILIFADREKDVQVS